VAARVQAGAGVIANVFFIGGLTLVAAGAALWSLPAGLVVGGVLVCAASVLSRLGRREL
jgi:hypothetical protein